MNILLIMIAIPVVMLIIEALLSKRYSIVLASISAALMLLLSIYLLVENFVDGGISTTKSIAFIPALGVSFSLTLNTFSVVLLLLSSIVIFVAASSGNIKAERVKLSSALMLLFQVAATGIFTSGNLLLFFIFWDIGVVTAFLMINTLGHSGSKIASMNFLIYEIFASVMLLFAILLIYFYTPLHTFDIASIISGASQIPASTQSMIMVFLLIAFMVNMPIFPLHSWLPDAYSEASTQGSMIIGGILSKFGAFGLLLSFELMPIASHYSIYVFAFSVFSSIYASLVMISQKDIKRIIAYAAMAEMGVIGMGISAYNTFGTFGALYGMLAQGLSIAFMFLIAGSIMHEFGERDIRLLKGIVMQSKAIAYSFVLGIFFIGGLPLTAGFIADLLIFIGAYKSFSFYAFIPFASIILMASYLYYVANKSIFECSSFSKNVSFIGASQKIGYTIFITAIFALGMMPFIILNVVH
ncbi:MAG: complex I subunit 4 family protein [Candidatus Micrarchaeia archaeon]